MTKITPESLGQLALRKRGSMGVRAAAAEIGISAATLSRIERGHVADVATLNKVFHWLGLDPRDYFGSPGAQADTVSVQVVFKNKKTLSPQSAQSLANLLMAAHQSFAESIKSEG
jgi:transcriptional regulator with XRE-family HTH domain